MGNVIYPGDMPPWEQVPFFASPTETFLSGATAGTQLASGNARRTHLIFSNPGGSILVVSTKSNPGTQQGMALGTALGVLVITARDFGPLVTVPWYLASSGPANITVFEVVADDWPDPQNVQPDGSYFDAQALPYAVDPTDNDVSWDSGYYYRALKSAANRLIHSGY